MSVELADLEKVSTADATRKLFAEIQENNIEGLLRAEDIVDSARHPDSAIHKYFEWDDGIAAEKYRLSQARAMIRKLVVVGPDIDASPVPKYVSLQLDRAKPGGGYRETKQVVASKELLKQLEETAKKDIDGVLHRYQMLTDLCERVRRAAGIESKPKKK